MAWTLIRIVMSVCGVHLEVAQAEVKRDASRLVVGLVMLVLAGLFVAFVLLAAHAAAILALYENTQLAWYGSILVVGGSDLALALLLVVVGRSRLRKPVLTETRGLVRRTVAVLREV